MTKNILKNHKTTGTVINTVIKTVKKEITEQRCGSLGKLFRALGAP